MLKKRFYWIALVGVAGLVSTGQNQCDRSAAPFNVSGSYSGTWNGTLVNAAGEAISGPLVCPLTLAFTHDPSQRFPRSLNGTAAATVNFTCLGLPEILNPILTPTIETTFVLGLNGSLLTGQVGTGLATGTFVAMVGDGADTNGDGFMDVYSGTWDAGFVIPSPGVQPVHVQGTFSVTRF